MKNLFLTRVICTLFLCAIIFDLDCKTLKFNYFENFADTKQDPPSNRLGKQLWKAQHLNGTQDEWYANSGGGEFNSGTGNSSISKDVARSGEFSLKMEIDTRSGSSHGTRNYRWNEISRNDDLIFTQYFYFPHRIDFDRNNDWFNLIQTKGVKFAEGGPGSGPDQINLPHFVLGLEVRGGTGSGGPNFLSLADLQKFWGGSNDRVWRAPKGVDLPTNKWVKIQIRLIQDRGDEGRVLVFQDDQLIIDTGHLNTLKPEVDTNMYSVNAYADKTYPNITKIYIDDLSINLPAEEKEEKIPTPPNVNLIAPEDNLTIYLGESINIESEVSIIDNNEILELAFYGNNEKIGTTTSPPYNLTWKPNEIGEYKIKVTAKDIYLQESISELIKINVVEEKNIITDNKGTIRINMGGNEKTIYNSTDYIVDRYIVDFDPTAYTFSNTSASNEKIFQTERNQTNLKFNIPVPNGIYKVKTYHNELWFGKDGPSAQKGRRVFDIYIQDEKKVDNFDLFDHNNYQTILTFEKIEVKNNLLSLNLVAKANRATISALSIIPDNESLKDIQNISFSNGIHINTGSADEVNYLENLYKGESETEWIKSETFTFSNNNASTDQLFNSERFGLNVNYEIPVKDGVYKVKTYHNELWFGHNGPSAQEGRRVFDIFINGQERFKNFDIFKENNNQPTILTFEEVKIENGILSIELNSIKNRASISGLSIIPMDTQPNQVETIEEKVFNPILVNTGENLNTRFKEDIYTAEPENELNFSSSSIFINRNASDDELFQSERNALNLSYSIPVPNGDYEIRTYHNELWFGQNGPSAQPGRRVFDINIEGQLKKEGFDLFTESNNSQTILIFENIKVSDGILNIDLKARSNRATISGLAIIPKDSKLGNENLRGYRSMQGSGNFKTQESTKLDFPKKIFPNPAKEEINYSFGKNNKIEEISLLDINGTIKRVWKKNELSNLEKNVKLDITPYQNGLYILNVYTEGGQIEKHKILIRK